ncbi:MAG: response regulator [Nocardioidaceae bacterium]|nr:response regulator [Nocardioidaceae bacterium]
MTVLEERSTRAGTIRTVIADDSSELRSLVRAWLDDAGGIEVVGEAGDGAEAVALVEALRPDVVLLDVAMPIMDGFQALQEIHDRLPSLPVVMLSGFPAHRLAARAAEYGAAGYVEKDGNPLPVLAAIRRAAGGHVAESMQSPAADHKVPGKVPITPRAVRQLPAQVETRHTKASWWLPFAAVVLFAGIFAFRRTVDDPSNGIGVLYVLPVTLLAIRYRLAGGLIGAGISAALFWQYAHGREAPPIDYFTRYTAFLTVGIAVGVFARQVARLSAARARDETALVAANRRLVEISSRLSSLNESLEGANEDLRQFSYVASHDLAEPLRTMSGFAHLLESRYSDCIDARGREFLEYIVAGAERMQNLIDDVRAYSKAGQHELRKSPVALDDVVADVRASLSATLAERNAMLDVPHPLPVVIGDRSLLVLVVQNLVTNAIKFNQSSTPTVRFEGSTADGRVALCVSDNGIGIPTEHHERVFSLFQRLHTKEEYPGTGLGLAIIHRIVTRHGGSIQVEPSSAGGTTFEIELPGSDE